VVELAMYLRNFIEGKYADLAYINGAYWSGRTPAGTALEAQTVGGGAPVGKTYPEIVEAIGKVMTAVGDEATADTARKANRVLRDKMVRTVLWANHTPIIVGPRVAYYENYPGFAYLHRLEYLKLKD
jgi:hypothetical protein